MKCPMCQGTGRITVFDMQVNDENMLDATSSKTKPCPMGCKALEVPKRGNQRLSGNEMRPTLDELKRLKKQHDKMHGEKDYSVTTETIPLKEWYGLE